MNLRSIWSCLASSVHIFWWFICLLIWQIWQMSTLCLSASLLEHCQCFLCEGVILIFECIKKYYPKSSISQYTPEGAWSVFDKIIPGNHITWYRPCCQWIPRYSSLLWVIYWQCSNQYFSYNDELYIPSDLIEMSLGPGEISWSSGLYKPIHSSSRQCTFTMSWNVLQSIRSFMPGNAWNAENRGWGKTAMLLKFGPWRSKQEGCVLPDRVWVCKLQKKFLTVQIG